MLYKNSFLESWDYNLNLGISSNLNKQERKEFIYQNLVNPSNLIENIKLSDWQSLERVPELEDHYDAWQYMLDNQRSVPSEDDIKNLHGILMKNLLGSAGSYRERYVCIKKSIFQGISIWSLRKGCMKYLSVPKSMKNLVGRINELDDKTIADKTKKIDVEKSVLQLHYLFESIHPFEDGNGRVGRVLLNWLTIRMLDKLIMIDPKNKQDYYSEINKYSKKMKKKNSNLFYNDYFTQEYSNIFLISDFSKKERKVKKENVPENVIKILIS